MARHAEYSNPVSIVDEIVEIIEIALDAAFVNGMEAQRENSSAGDYGVSRDYYWGVLQGKEDERERIIRLLEGHKCDLDYEQGEECWCGSYVEAIALIKCDYPVEIDGVEEE